MTLALVSLELLAQVLSLSLFPSAGSLGGLYPSACGCEIRGTHVSAGSASNLVRELLCDLLGASRAADPEQDDCDGDGGLIDRVHVEVIARNKARATSAVLPRPDPIRSPGGHNALPAAIVDGQVDMRPVRLSRLTC